MSNHIFWPGSQVFRHPAAREQISDGLALCTAVAICDEHGEAITTFYQGQVAHFFYEFEITGSVGAAYGGLEFHDSSGQVIYGKNTFQHDVDTVPLPKVGDYLRYHQTIKLDVAPGQYWVTLGLASTEEAAFHNYVHGNMGFLEFREFEREHCRVVNIGSFKVELRPNDKLLHHGIANLPGSSWSSTITSGVTTSLRSIGLAESIQPTIFHVTHWKAGSQWIYKILQDCASERIVAPQVDELQFLRHPIEVGKVYPTVYVTKQQYDTVQLPANWSRFVVIRDLRDTLISAYFSFKVSHPVLSPLIKDWREILQSRSKDDGLLYLMAEWLPACARIQASWVEAGEHILRYEDLLEHDLELLEPVLIDECRLPVSREQFRQIVLKNRFASLTNGRNRGREDVSAHERKGIAGDWRNHFSRRVKREFKDRFGQLLIATGYESHMNW